MFTLTRYIVSWGRHSSGDELKASPQERLSKPFYSTNPKFLVAGM
jgi:hypothetical protein